MPNNASYKIESGYLGQTKSGTLALSSSTKQSKTIAFTTSDFSNKNYYRISTYFSSADVDTNLSLMQVVNSNAYTIAINDNKSSTDLYSEIVFIANPRQFLYI